MNIQERIPKLVYQLKIQAKQEKSLALARIVLLNSGYNDQEIVGAQFIAPAKNNLGSIELFDECKEKIVRVKKLFDRLAIDGLEIIQRRLLPKDWLTLWKSQWRPAPLTKKLDIVPVWYQSKYKPQKGRDYLLMDTLLSFGTGLHETTRFMAQFIEDNEGKFQSFFDIGTGTGILALVALKYGAKEVFAVDIGQLSVQASKDNMKANGLYFHVCRADIKKYRSRKTFDFVAANLITEDLMANAKSILNFVKVGGFLAVSGISLDNLSRLRKAFAGLPLKVLKVSKGQQWSGLLYQKTMS